MKICMTFVGLTLSNGVARSAIAIANLLVEKKGVDVTLIPVFKYDGKAMKYLNSKVKVQKPILPFYFRGLAKILLLFPARLLYKLFIREKYDIEIAFQYEVPTIIIKGSTNIEAKHYCWMHTYDEGLKFRHCYEQMDKMVVVSKCGANRLREELNNRVKIDYCYNPIDDIEICHQGNEVVNTSRGEGPLFVSVGRMSPEKGYARLLNIVHRLKVENYKFHLWLIGNGPILENLKDECKKLNIEDMVDFLGPQSNPHKYTSKADVFICSSFSEGYSTACTEAIMLGIPVITTNCSGGAEIIEEAECGILTEMDDDSLYQGIKHALDNQQLINEWKEKLKFTKKRFSQSERANQIFKVLEIS